MSAEPLPSPMAEPLGSSYGEAGVVNGDVKGRRNILHDEQVRNVHILQEIRSLHVLSFTEEHR